MPAPTFGPYTVPVEGVVTDYIPAGDRRNKFPWDVYRVAPIDPNMPPIENAQLALAYSGFDGGVELPLRPRSRVVGQGGPSAQKPLEDKTPPSTTDGDRVIVQFLMGSSSRPIITNVLPHWHANWRTDADDRKSEGRSTRMLWNGTELKLTKEGNIEIGLGKGDEPVTNASDKSLTVALDESTKLVLTKASFKIMVNDTEVANFSESLANLGAYAGADFVALSEKVTTELGKIRSFLDALNFVISGTPIPEPGVGAPSAFQIALKAAAAAAPLASAASVAAEKTKAS